MIRYQSQEVASLAETSARIGRDPLLVQAGSGNTSVKLDGTLWVKASGKWLARASDEDLFVPVSLAAAHSSLRRNLEIKQEYLNAAGVRMKPSVETATHSLIPHRVVIHVHSVSTIAWAVRRDGPAQLTERLAGLGWQWVPWAASGNELAYEVAKAVERTPHARVFVLANHGLIVCGESPEEAEALLFEVERRVRIEPRPAAAPDVLRLQRLASGSRWRLPECPDFHVPGTDSISRNILARGIFYPWQAILFDNGTPPVYSPSSFEVIRDLDEPLPWLAAIDGIGVLISRKLTETEQAMLGGLIEILRRIGPSASLACLAQHEIARALNFEASYAPVPIG